MCVCQSNIRTPWCSNCEKETSQLSLLQKAGYMKFETNNPPTHGYYLCVGHGGTRYICLMSNGKWYRQSGSKQIVGITHWMQIP
jgi:hypothetical protein